MSSLSNWLFFKSPFAVKVPSKISLAATRGLKIDATMTNRTPDATQFRGFIATAYQLSDQYELL